MHHVLMDRTIYHHVITNSQKEYVIYKYKL